MQWQMFMEGRINTALQINIMQWQMLMEGRINTALQINIFDVPHYSNGFGIATATTTTTSIYVYKKATRDTVHQLF